MHPVRFRTVTGTSRPLTASTTQQRTALNLKDKGEAVAKKRKSTVEALVPLPKRICLSGRHIRLSPQHDRSQHPLPEAQWG